MYTLCDSYCFPPLRIPCLFTAAQFHGRCCIRLSKASLGVLKGCIRGCPMADPYYRYGGSPADRAGLSRTSFPGYLPSEVPSLASHHVPSSSDLWAVGSEYLPNDINFLRTGAYGGGDILGTRLHSETVFNGVTTGASIKSYPSLEEREIPAGINSGVLDINTERAISKSNYDSPPVSGGDSNVLFVGGLPNDCTRREVGHLFRPFIGYKDIKVVHKEPRHSGDKAVVLCFVEFVDSKCALTAMEALQGYKFDDKKPESQTLKIQFAHFPFRLPHEHGEQRFSMPRGL